jgi:hypothetical protein
MVKTSGRAEFVLNGSKNGHSIYTSGIRAQTNVLYATWSFVWPTGQHRGAQADRMMIGKMSCSKLSRLFGYGDGVT